MYMYIYIYIEASAGILAIFIRVFGLKQALALLPYSSVDLYRHTHRCWRGRRS